MESKVLFYERQRFRQWWVWTLLLISIFTNATYLVITFTDGFSPNNTGLVIATSVILLIILLIFFSHLDTKIKTDGIHIRFSPFHLKWRHYPWSKLKKVYVRRYAPLTEYGGWGIRLGMAIKRGRAFNVSGNKGIQLIFKNDKKLLIGTQKPEKVKKMLSQYFTNE